MQMHIIENGIVTNTIMATVAEAAAAFPDAQVRDAALGGAIGDSWDGSVFTPPASPEPTVPASVTRRQARQALLLAGKLELVQPAINAIPNATHRAMAQIEWDDSLEFLRERPLVISIGGAIGLDAAGLDALFIAAGNL